MPLLPIAADSGSTSGIDPNALLRERLPARLRMIMEKHLPADKTLFDSVKAAYTGGGLSGYGEYNVTDPEFITHMVVPFFEDQNLYRFYRRLPREIKLQMRVPGDRRLKRTARVIRQELKRLSEGGTLDGVVHLQLRPGVSFTLPKERTLFPHLEKVFFHEVEEKPAELDYLMIGMGLLTAIVAVIKLK